MLPNELFLKANAHLLEVSKIISYTVTLSDLICDAVDIYLWGEEENKKLEEERERTKLEKNGKM